MQTQCLHRNPSFKLRQEEDGNGLISDSRTADIFVLNPVAMSIMKFVSEKAATRDQIVEHICGVFGDVERTRVGADVDAFVADALDKGMLCM